MTHPNLDDVKRQGLAWFTSLALLLALAGCDSASIVRVINQGTDGNGEFWVCEGGAAQPCRGEQQGDIDPRGIQKRLQVVAPPSQCSHGVAASMDIVIDKGDIVRVRYECGLPASPTGLPPSSGAGTPRTN